MPHRPDADDFLDAVRRNPVVAEVLRRAEERFGVPYPPLRSSAGAVDRYAAHACRVAVRSCDGRLDVYAPSGFDDLFAFVLRPNPVVAPRVVYERKAARWARLWPRLQVLPWAEPAQRPRSGSG